jgi:hypothetical protein
MYSLILEAWVGLGLKRKFSFSYFRDAKIYFRFSRKNHTYENNENFPKIGVFTIFFKIFAKTKIFAETKIFRENFRETKFCENYLVFE